MSYDQRVRSPLILYLNRLPTGPFDGLAALEISVLQGGWRDCEAGPAFTGLDLGRAPGCLGYIGDCTGDDATQLCGHYDKPL